MREIELKIHDMSTTLHPADAYALVLEEKEGGRKLPIIIGHLEAQAIKVMMLKYQPPRPLTHDLFKDLTGQLGVTMTKMLIYKAKGGVFYSYLYFDKDGTVVESSNEVLDGIPCIKGLKFDTLMFDRMLAVPQNFEIQKNLVVMM